MTHWPGDPVDFGPNEENPHTVSPRRIRSVLEFTEPTDMLRTLIPPCVSVFARFVI